MGAVTVEIIFETVELSWKEKSSERKLNKLYVMAKGCKAWIAYGSLWNQETDRQVR